ncbi:MAG: hypothetical protein KDA81_18280 [Planctomycetaceae bacterium]|nr:hypothetical protein [Planctomycetaceae bacterium]
MSTPGSTIIPGRNIYLWVVVPALVVFPARGQAVEAGLTPVLRGLVRSGIALAADRQEAAQETVDLKTGREFQMALQQRMSLAVNNLPLQDVVRDIIQRTGIAVVIDRRVDPGRLIEVNTPLTTVRLILLELSKSVEGTGISVCDDFVYLGPSAAAKRLRTLCELNAEAVRKARSKLSPTSYRYLTGRTSGSWGYRSEPSDVFLLACGTVPVSENSPSHIPFDLWRSCDLPSVKVTDYMTVLLNQFDLSFEITDAGEVSVESLSAPVGVERRHRVPSSRVEELKRQWSESFPDLTFRWQGSSVTVVATVEQHEAMQESLSGSAELPVGENDLRKRLFTLRIPAGATVKVLLEQLRKSGIRVEVQGELSDEDLERPCEALSLERVPGIDFFPRLLLGLNVEVLADHVTINSGT